MRDGYPSAPKNLRSLRDRLMHVSRRDGLVFGRLQQHIGLLVVSQFTLAADTRKGRRPSFIGAAEPGRAEALYLRFVAQLHQLGVSRVATGRFRADMQVELINDGPVTIWLDPKE